MEIIKNNKGGEKLCYGGYSYTKKATTLSTKRWECTKRKAFSCNGKVITDFQILTIISFKDHNHLPDLTAIKCAKVHTNMKENALQGRGNTRQIVLDAMVPLSQDEQIAMGEMETIKRRIRRYRCAGRPNEPRSLQDLKIEGEWAFTKGPNPQNFLLHDNGINSRNRILIFGTDEGFLHLAESEIWYMDGTFSCAPNLFQQIYIIRAPLGESAVTCVYAFLTGKSQEIYEEMLQAIIDEGNDRGIQMNVNMTMTDFEIAMMNAIRNKLGHHIKIKACFYHLTQSTFRKIQELGLTSLYINDRNVRHVCGMIDGLAFVPLNRVSDGMQYIKNNAPAELQELIDYFDKTYVTGTYRATRPRNFHGQNGRPRRNVVNLRRVPPLFPPSIWNMCEITINNQSRTNNLCESWNRGFKDLVGYSHPSIWTAIECIRKDAAGVSTDLVKNNRGQILKKRTRRETVAQQRKIRDICMAYVNGQKTLTEMLQVIGHNIRLG